MMTHPPDTRHGIAEAPPPVFDATHYARSGWAKLVRSLQLGPAYYGSYLPRYLWNRLAAGISPWDWQAVWNPLREFYPAGWRRFELPDRYDEALRLLDAGGVQLTLPPVRIAGLALAWWGSRASTGDVIECGAYRGATSLLIAVLGRLNEVPQTVYMLDTFSGVERTSEFDVSRNGREFTAEPGQVDRIRRQAEQLGVLSRISIHQGLFADSFTRLAECTSRFAFAHIDANLYDSTFEACEFVLPRMSPGAAVVFDDYNGVCDLGARLAIDRSLSARHLRPAPLAGSSALLRIPGQPQTRAETGSCTL
jgi:hypothetical protein